MTFRPFPYKSFIPVITDGYNIGSTNARWKDGYFDGYVHASGISFFDGTTQYSAGGGAGTPGGLTAQVQFNNAGAFAGDSNFTWDNSNKRLGIGTSIPTSTLDIYKSVNGPNKIYIKNPNTGTSASANLQLENNANNAIQVIMGSSTFSDAIIAAGEGAIQVNSGPMLLRTIGTNYIRFSPNDVEALRILSGGNVGIGTTVAANILTIGIDGSASAPAIAFGSIADSNTGIYHPAADTLSFATAGTERLQINPSGFVGIGTTPSVPFHVYKNDNSASPRIRFENGNNGAAANVLVELLNSGSYGLQLHTFSSAFTTSGPRVANSSLIHSNTTGTGTLELLNTTITNASIGFWLNDSTNTGSTEREMVRFKSNQAVFNDAANDVDFRIESQINANLFFLDASTNRIGIGTSTPGEMLTLEGRLALLETTAPTASTNYGKIYVKSSDSKPYFMDDSGTEGAIVITDGYGYVPVAQLPPPAYSILSYASSVNIDVASTTAAYREITLTGNITLALTNKAAGLGATVFLIADTTTRTLTTPAGMKWMGGAPTSVLANKSMTITFVCRGTTDALIVGSYTTEL